MIGLNFSKDGKIDGQVKRFDMCVDKSAKPGPWLEYYSFETITSAAVFNYTSNLVREYLAELADIFKTN